MTAKAFFEQLATFSDRYVQKELKLQSAISPWGGRDRLEPKGAVLHFTADEDPLRVLRWFLKEKYGAKASSQVVVFDRMYGGTKELMEDLPLVQALPVTVIQCRRPDQVAWHATWTNSTLYGIENVCAGELRKDATGSFTSWRPRDQSSPDWTMPWKCPYKEPVKLRGKWWSPYPSDQVLANVMILRAVHELYGLIAPWIIGHEACQGIHTKSARGRDKRDPGPAYPIHGVRESVFQETPIDQAPWFHQYQADPMYGQSVEDGFVIQYAKRVADEELDADPTPEVAWSKFRSDIEALPFSPEEPFGAAGKTALRVLGYEVDHLEIALSDDEVQSVRIFQKMMGLHVDGDPGVATRNAIVERLKDRGCIDPEESLDV